MPKEKSETVNEKYKDRLLNFIFGSEENKEWTLSLYNGKRNVDDDTILKLSDSFSEEHRDEADVEVRVRMININYGHNEELLGACKPLQEYSWFIEKVRDYYEDYTLEDSVEMAIREMPDDFLIKQFIVINKAEVCKMLLTEYDEAEAQELFKNEGRDEGSTKRLIELICKKLEKGKSIGTIADEVEETVESIKPICNIAEKHAPNYDVDAIYDELRNKK